MASNTVPKERNARNLNSRFKHYEKHRKIDNENQENSLNNKENSCHNQEVYNEDFKVFKPKSIRRKEKHMEKMKNRNFDRDKSSGGHLNRLERNLNEKKIIKHQCKNLTSGKNVERYRDNVKIDEDKENRVVVVKNKDVVESVKYIPAPLPSKNPWNKYVEQSHRHTDRIVKSSQNTEIQTERVQSNLERSQGPIKKLRWRQSEDNKVHTRNRNSEHRPRKNYNNEHNRYERKSKRQENTGHRARRHKPESGIPKFESFVENEQIKENHPVPVPSYKVPFIGGFYINNLNGVNLDSTTRKEYIKKQIEYYFSEENLQRDLFMRRKMNSEGYLPIALIATFKRVQSLTTDLSLIIDSIIDSKLLEINPFNQVRTAADPLKWPIPFDPKNPISDNSLIQKVSLLQLYTHTPQEEFCPAAKPLSTLPTPPLVKTYDRIR
ncbi:GATA zinc finger domain-containing protein 14-like [Microplitis mediator]|uniref:GATA zinc finger domain-containing protein 14-like n=1 Tax=Microplitis mediator TaxID=375433 RepID=UPI002552B1FC|nr:GATA zinc finger domain-containing protein 14-like [Microplitis mediator]